MEPPGSTSVLEADFNRQNHALASELERRGAEARDHQLPRTGGTHGWPYWQRELHSSLPMLLQAVGADGWTAAIVLYDHAEEW
ncbi:hypothetical protein [Streptomyces sp. NPDC024089]|uniref:hypothetical protein n=1 Tax=Streptomyces sp. NPDC024089 TaxID=3154328 RepID=UPI0033C4CA51